MATNRLQHVSERFAARLDEPRLSVAPLIDVCFLLLIYFMVTTTLKPAERDVTTRLGHDGPGSPAVPTMIQVREDGAIVLNPGRYEIWVSTDADERKLPQLEDHLETLRIGSQELPPILVSAEGGAHHQRVVDVMNLLQKIGWSRVGFVDDKP